jgi:hypothetical protein
MQRSTPNATTNKQNVTKLAYLCWVAKRTRKVHDRFARVYFCQFFGGSANSMKRGKNGSLLCVYTCDCQGDTFAFIV